ncbi:fatty acyl-AMP ligase [Jatrophihabitans sp.]|uniref:fatty acyl-AMP ligase n=1 Tax=Jatrophihabitans sp. TaxID=1932789 RepID=UPI002EDF67A5
MSAFPSNLLHALDACAAEQRRGFAFQDYDGKETTWSFGRVREEAVRRATFLRAQGVEPGDRVILVLPEAADFVPAILGAMWLGAIPVPMYPPLSLGKVPAYQETLRKVTGAVLPKAVLTVDWLRQVVEPVADESGVKTVAYEAVLVEGLPSAPAAEVGPEDTAFLQFTSGSTSDPKGVVVTHGSLRANAHAIMVDGLRVDQGMSGVSWLPLYHDMGLIGFVLSPIFTQSPVTFIPTLAFLKKPAVWLQTLHDTRATVTFAPNFAYALLVKKTTPEQRAGWDLSAVRAFGCGAEPINVDTMRAFLDSFAASGVEPSAMLPCYGMAEATLAMAFLDVAAEYTVDVVDREAYRGGRALAAGPGEAATVRFVGCGRALAGHRLAIMAGTGQLLPDREIGEIVFAGPSVAAGYFDNPEATAATFDDGWLHTGDLGYLVDGEVFITGRKKDIIVINGRNHDPQRIEWTIDEVPGVRRGNVAAFSVPGEDSEKLVIVYESAEPDETVAGAIRRRVQAGLQLSVADVVRLEPGQLPKTSSGKLQRQRTRQLYLDGGLADVVVASRAVGGSR